ncbi:ABC transporter ATP-binding protein [Myxococcus sp. K15C18031901]|uniref:ABC transporter ATP-binding protein n=1 Tax=Myxococcus dinghuensis TaxID=2906761 RepID=UPI0020A7B216|nr:ABC transporter ATP-binding protein [Myxococcus dinghuensis]MCP3102876.1 ABC transporter ATP-binding protein [Myxococcus dinghuensis]
MEQPPPSSTGVAARLQQVTKQYQLGKTTVHALRGIDLTIAIGSYTVICGPSGSGKSTALQLLGCLDMPTSGTLEIAGQDVIALSDAARTTFRAQHLGFVFQNFNLLPVLTALENVEYPLQLTVRDPAERRERARAMLTAVGLGDLLHRRPAELSGGQRQRVAVARAMVKRPRLVLADEPTANLDRRTGAELIALMRAMQREHQTTFILSSHDPQMIEDADERILIEDGRVVESTRRQAPLAPAQGVS